MRRVRAMHIARVVGPRIHRSVDAATTGGTMRGGAETSMPRRMVLIWIVVGEVAFWAFVVAGLSARYLLGRARPGAALLLATPLVDASLLAASALDLRDGGAARPTHGLAFTYLGFTVAFGKSTIRWADARFGHRFAGTPAPPRSPRYGRAKARHEWQILPGKCWRGGSVRA
jgi:hypothetical protein